MNRLENYYLAKDALSYMEGMATGEAILVGHAMGVMEMFSYTRGIKQRCSFKNAVDIIELLDEMMSRNGIVEDEHLQMAFDLICEKVIDHMKSLCTPEEFEQWCSDVLTNWGGRGDL